MFSYRRISNVFRNVSLNSFCGSAACQWAALDFGAVKSTSLTKAVKLTQGCKLVTFWSNSLFSP